MTRISVPYNDVYRWLFKIRRGVSISAIFVSKGIDSFNVLRRKLIYSFMQRIHTSENPLIQAMVQRSKFEESVVNREWTKALEEMTFSMRNDFIAISKDDRDVLQQERNTNLANILTNG